MNLALCYRNGDGVEKHIGKAIEVLELSAALGSDRAQYNLGVALDPLLPPWGTPGATLPDKAMVRKDPVRAAAFRALGDFLGPLDPSVFRDLGSITEPSVTAAIFDGMRRRGLTLPGAERIALRLSHHPDAAMAAAAFAFLKDGGANSVAFSAFSALDTDERREDWPRAFALLATHPDPGIVVGIMERLSTTRDPALRRGWLETLCWIRTTASGETWSKTAEIDASLIRALSDSRVDRVALLEAMEKARVPLDDPALLLRLGRENLGLEAFVIGRLLESKHSLPEGAMEWLEIVSADPARDEALRRSAQALQSGEARKDRPGPSSAPAPLPPLTDGQLLFRSLGCAGCHNLDGEGFAVGPDLVAVFSGLSASEAKDRLAHPSGPAPVRLETSAGRILSGWIVEEQTDRLILLDFAGNRFELDSGTITQRNPVPEAASPCRATAELDAASFAGLLEFLRSPSAP
jgi:putative heme-binding domain-containing protein